MRTVNRSTSAEAEEINLVARFFSPLVKLLRKVTKPRSFLSSLLSSAESSGLQLILTIPWQD